MSCGLDQQRLRALAGKLIDEHELALDKSDIGVSTEYVEKGRAAICYMVDSERCQIFLNERYWECRPTRDGSVENTLLHELVHAVQSEVLDFMSHGPSFRELARELDVSGLTRYSGIDEPDMLVECGECGAVWNRDQASFDPLFCRSCEVFRDIKVSDWSLRGNEYHGDVVRELMVTQGFI